MKKLTALLLALMLACMMIPAMADEDITGDWYASMYGMAINLKLDADGTLKMLAGDTVMQEGTWTVEDGKISLIPEEGESSVGEVREDGLYFADVETLFTREPVEAVTVAEVKAAESAEEFYGTWSLVYVEMEGHILDVSAVGEADAQVTLSDSAVEFAGEGTISMMLALMKMDAPTFADGVLSIKAAEDALNPNITITGEMLEDGMLKLTIVTDSAMVLYLTPVEAAEAPAA